MIRGEGTEVIRGVTPKEVWEFVLDPAQYTKADTKIIWVDKIADTEDGMIGLERGKFFGLKGSVVTRYVWAEDFSRIDVELVHGLLSSLHAWFEIEPVQEGTRIHHVETIGMAFGPVGALLERVWHKTFEKSVRQEVAEIRRLMEAGERGTWPQ